MSNPTPHHPLPARPSKSTYPITYHTAGCRPSGAARSILALLPSISPPSLAQVPLHHPLPPRPQNLTAPSPETLPAIQHTRTANHEPTYPNDFDHALQDPLLTASGNHNEADSSTVMSMKVHNDEYCNPLSGLYTPIPSPARLRTPSLTVPRPSSPFVDTAYTGAAQSVIRDRSKPANPLNDTSATDSEPLPASATYDVPPIASVGSKIDLASTSIESSASSSSAVDGDGEYINRMSSTCKIQGHIPESGEAPLPTENIDFEEALGVSESLRPSTIRRSMDKMPTPSEEAADLRTPIPIVRIPSLPRPSKPSRDQDQVSEKLDWDSGPSDDENDADYVSNCSEAERMDRNLRSSKRRKLDLIPEDASSDHKTEPLSKSRASSQRKTTSTSEGIPVHGFLTLSSDGPQVIYCVTLSQTAISSAASRPSSGTGNRRERSAVSSAASRPSSGTGNRRKKKSAYTPAEDALIVELKKRDLPWAEIEERFAQQFPRRSSAKLTARYHAKLKQ